MTLEQLEEELPNGFHDAQLRSFTRDFETGNLTFEVRVLTGLPDDPPGDRDAYRNGAVTFTGVELFIIESPGAASAFIAPGSVWFSVARSELNVFPNDIAERLTQGVNSYSFFVLDWHSSIHIAALDLRFEWR